MDRAAPGTTSRFRAALDSECDAAYRLRDWSSSWLPREKRVAVVVDRDPRFVWSLTLAFGGDRGCNQASRNSFSVT
jgi:hypothetical protein